MYLKKVERPRAVTLPDGSSFSLADLPDRNTRRWVASRKAAVVRGVLYGLISEADAEERYGVGRAEFVEWVRTVSTWGSGFAGHSATKV